MRPKRRVLVIMWSAMFGKKHTHTHNWESDWWRGYDLSLLDDNKKHFIPEYSSEKHKAICPAA